MDEGYIKFDCDWKKTPPLPLDKVKKLNEWRQKLYRAHLVGAYPDGIGFGNVSQRLEDNTFVISGSKTGNYKTLNERHYSKVVDFNIEKNWVSCEGVVIASSESMSHAVIYQQCPHVNAVFHIHSLEMWERLLFQIPTTSKDATYGTPEMAKEIIRLLQETDVLEKKIFAMAGHQEGIIAFGKNLDEAGNILLAYQKVGLEK